MSEHSHLEDFFIQALIDEKMPVSIFLVNGIKLHGIIDKRDKHVLLLKNTITQMVFKHAISTVVPSRALKIGD